MELVATREAAAIIGVAGGDLAGLARRGLLTPEMATNIGDVGRGNEACWSKAWATKMGALYACGVPFSVAIRLCNVAKINRDGSVTLARPGP